MSEAKHTPGPWLAASRPSSVVGLPVVATTNGRSVASVTHFALGKDFEAHDRESAANARLIAAAPELAAFAKAHDAYMLDVGYSGPEDEALHPKAAANWRACRAAIVKALGSPTPEQEPTHGS